MCNQINGPGPTPAKILWFGDSIVAGALAEQQGMRRPLWDYHVSIGFKMQLIGTLISPPGGLTQTYHDGHAGRAMQWLRDNVIAVSYGAGNAIESADLICVHMATNNMGFSGGTAYDGVATPQLYYDTLEELHLALPMARICPSPVGPFDRSTQAIPDDNAIDFRTKLLGDVFPDFEAAYPGVLIHGWDAWSALGGVWAAPNYADASHQNMTGCVLMVDDPTDGLIQALQAAGVHS